MTVPEYYPCRVRLGGDEKFVAWFTADLDGFLRGPGGRLVVADSAGALGVPLVTPEPAEYDFDRIRDWCAACDPAGTDCPSFLNAWNFLDDLAGLHAGADTPHTRLSAAAGRVYDKLFWGTNLPAVTPPGERYTAAWSPQELTAIREVFESGLSLLTAELAGRAARQPVEAFDAEPDAASDWNE